MRFPTTLPALRGQVRSFTLAGAIAAFLLVGGTGAYRYARNYWLYRGFAPPTDPAFVTTKGSVQRFYVQSTALGGRRQPVDVYLPPDYAAQPARRYPVFYLLHGFPGRPGAFLQTVRMGVVEDVLLAKHRAQPLILVMPFGSTGTFNDKEWANGVRPNERWETFVAHDLVQAVDSRYRTIASGSARALGGLSEGGYGAFNIGLHNPGEFKVLESWSGYERAADLRSIFGHEAPLLTDNSPLLELGRTASALKRMHTYFWFYTGSDDRLRPQNAAFAGELAREGIPYRFFIRRGGHDWALWRGSAAAAYLAASEHLSGA